MLCKHGMHAAAPMRIGARERRLPPPRAARCIAQTLTHGGMHGETRRVQVWAYIRKESLPYNALHDEGYTSVGDMVSTEKPEQGADERQGRWKGSSKSECECVGWQ